MPAWPVSLPVKVQMDGFSAQMPDALLQSEMEAGEPKTRRRFTAAHQPIQVSWVMTHSQWLVFDDWFRNEISMGAVPWDWTHPIKDEACRAMFPKNGLPNVVPHGSQWKVSATVWILP